VTSSSAKARNHMVAATRAVPRRWRWLVALFAIAALHSAPALALSQRGHVFSFSFGSNGPGELPLANPAGVAVSEAGTSAGDVYVVDRANNRVEKFDAAGKLVSVWGWGVSDEAKDYEVCNSPSRCKAGTPGSGKGIEKLHLGKGQLVSPVAIAVDNSPEASDPSRGDVYVAAAAANERSYVYKLGPEGKYLGHLTNKAETEFDGRPEGVAVDASGVVWVQWSEGEIVGFTPAGRRVKNSEGEPEEIEAAVGPLRPGLGLGADGGLYVTYEPGEKFEVAANEESRYSEEGRGENGEEPCEQSPCIAAKLSLLGEAAREVGPGGPLIEELDRQNTSGIAVDPASAGAPGDAVYLDNVTSVSALTPTGSLIQRFGDEGGVDHIARGAGVAVDAASGDVYVADAGADEIDVFTPEPPGAPTVESLSAEDVSSEAAQLDAVIDPRGAQHETSDTFEYGTVACASAPGACTKVAGGKIGGAGFGDEGFGEERVSVRLGGTDAPLLPGTTYHYRVSAENGLGTVTSTELSFAVPAATGQFVADGRVWELVSPTDKGGAVIEPLTYGGAAIQAAKAGDAITYVANAPIGDPEGSRSLENTQILSTRTETGWSSRDIVTPNDHGAGIEEGAPPEYQLFSAELSQALVQPFDKGGLLAEPPLSPALSAEEAGHQENTIYLRDDAPIPTEAGAEATHDYEAARTNGEAEHNAGYLPLVTGANVPPVGETHTKVQFGQALTFLDATPDLTHVMLASSVPLTPGSESGKNLYEWSDGQLQLINVLPGTKEEEEKGIETAAAAPDLGAQSHIVRSAISSDGARVFWTGEPSLGLPPHLYVRDTQTKRTVQVDALQGGSGEGNDNPVFQDASADGARAFFSDEQDLTPGAGASEGNPDLYVYETTTGTLSDLTNPLGAGEPADVQGFALGAAADGSSIYFVANGVLSTQAASNGETAAAGRCRSEAQPISSAATCNLYVVSYDAEPGDPHWEAPRFLASLSNQDEPDWEGPTFEQNQGELTARVSGNGRYLAFMSDRQLTGYDNRASMPAANGAPAEEVFLFDAAGGRIACASCDPSGARPTGVYDPTGAGEGPEGLGLVVDRTKTWEGRWLAGSIPGWTQISHLFDLAPYQSRYLSDSGRLFFDSPEPLVPQDTNGKEDVYEYEPRGVPRGVHECTGAGATFSGAAGGCVGLISSGSGTRESAFLDASESGGEGQAGEQLQEGGGDVFFVTATPLVPQDTGMSLDVYDAHECTARSQCVIAQGEQTPEACESSAACRPSPQAPSSPASVATGATTGSPNVVAQHQVASSKTSATPKPPTRAQQLAKALKACWKDRKKHRRAACERQARRRYGPARKRAKAKKSAAAARGHERGKR
jgi:DNA-binding beta-propeller fold protein YncE